jgi:glycopeptide antibiotics resistance protein
MLRRLSMPHRTEGFRMLMTDGYLTAIPGYWMVLPALPVAWLIWRRGEEGRADRWWTLLALLALAHVTAVVALTIFPIPISGQEYYRATRGLTQDNIVPFHTIADQLAHLRPGTVRQLVGNSIALVPLAVYGPGLWARLRDWRWFAAAAVGFAVAIELTQLAGSLLEGFTYRVTDVDDAIMNATGAVIAFFIWRALEVRPPVSGWLARLGLAQGVPIVAQRSARDPAGGSPDLRSQ